MEKNLVEEKREKSKSSGELGKSFQKKRAA